MAALFILVSACGLAPKDKDTGIMGTVTIGPVSPVSKPGEPDSVPYADASFIVRNLATGKKIKAVSDKDGLFQVLVPEGRYVLESEAGGTQLPFLKPVEVEVVKGSFTEVIVSFDSGIR
jgi:hypothetical protein